MLNASGRFPEGKPPKPSKPLAIAHEWLAARAGSEILFEQLAAAFPDADLYALSRNPEVSFDFSGRTLHTTALDVGTFLRERREVTLPFMPLAWKALRRPSYDVVITSSHAFGREFVKPGDQLHLNYVHAPMRYAWSPELDGRARLEGRLGRVAARALRAADLRTVSTVDSFAANSRAVAERIGQFYDRHARVIHPPVDTEYFNDVESGDGGYLLSASRFVHYKRHDLAIEAAARVDMPLVVAGSGPQEEALRDLADRVHPGGVTFVVKPERKKLRDLMAGASALVFPAHEDFGIIVAETQATGTPVVALRAGGTLDTVVDRKTGALAEEQTPDAFAEAILDCLDLQLAAQDCRWNANRFSAEVFVRAVQSWVEDAEMRS